MRKILVLISLACLKMSSQSFYKGALVTDVNAGTEIYNTILKVHNSANGRDTTQNDKAGNFHFTIGAEYGLHKRLGVGLRYKAGNYFVDKDSSGRKGSVKSNDIVAQVNFHAVTGKALDLVLGGDIGYSKLNWTFDDKDNTKVWASGMFYSLYVNPRLYIGRFGFNAKLSLPFTSYPKLNSDNPNFTKDQSYKFREIPGFGFNIGIQFRFMEERGKKETKETK